MAHPMTYATTDDDLMTHKMMCDRPMVHYIMQPMTHYMTHQMTPTMT